VPLLQVAPVELSQQSLLAEHPLCPFCRQQTAPTQLSVLSQQSAGDVHAKAPVITQQVPLLQVAPVEFSQQSVLAEQPLCPFCRQQAAPTQLSVLSQQSAGDVHAKAPVIMQQVPLLQVAPVEFSQQSVLAEQPEDPLGMQLPRAPCATNSTAVRTSTATACSCLLAT
jgi:hypothetical protein